MVHALKEYFSYSFFLQPRMQRSLGEGLLLSGSEKDVAFASQVDLKVNITFDGGAEMQLRFSYQCLINSLA